MLWKRHLLVLLQVSLDPGDGKLDLSAAAQRVQGSNREEIEGDVTEEKKKREDDKLTA